MDKMTSTLAVIMPIKFITHSKGHLDEIKAIKNIHTKTKMPEEMLELSQLLEEMMESGKVSLLRPLQDKGCRQEVIEQWLHNAITNIYRIMYTAGKQLWGERSQARMEIDRAASKKRTA
ncbi:LOW QUALITY PROTEIN: hypothetical protein PHMEG_00031061 [Phytophthora megakarya]|uniref:Uncharacterized protein n=1 Tax=Phytophthora megakarya TaxID=4795 RepID=A0A225UZ22_9STRA|nr:LOW QUALITY PROTEIN: hypothetical protein PHMEG_00031061 [Phytophthora megakarya]